MSVSVSAILHRDSCSGSELRHPELNSMGKPLSDPPYFYGSEWERYFNALLADLRTTLSPNGAGHVTSESYVYQEIARHQDDQPLYQNQRAVNEMSMSYEQRYSASNEVRPSSGVNSNLSELDSLLNDLSQARYASITTSTPYNGTTRQSRGSTGSGASPCPNESRPSVDSLLEELSHAATGTGDDGRFSPPSRQQTVAGASSATQELDALMASLSDFKIAPTSSSGPSQAVQAGEPTYAKPNKVYRPKASPNPDHLDSMLGNLQEDMNKQGVSATQKGCCSACDKPIVGQVITALGRTWHPDHFTCHHCRKELGTQNFFERDGQPYCEADYHNLFSPRCAYCNGPILDKCVTALDQTWHPEHFFCAQCGCQFGEDGFHEKDAKPYCKQDYFAMFAFKCRGCQLPITEGYISALSAQWHPTCFVCRECHMPFQGGSFFVHEGMPYCETHYHALRGTLCAGCHKPITGRCITAMFRKFHPEHFVCSYCLKQLKKGTFKEQNEKPYCHACFDRLFG